MAHQVDRAVDALDDVLRKLKDAMRGIPARREGFKRHHDNLAKACATLTVSLSDARHTIAD